ncbi:MAG TPA: CU044_5270 family protein [Micropruina sp.]|nr:CU044_5270 family protein [Micropruina sp.]
MSLLFHESMRDGDPAAGLASYSPDQRREILDAAVDATPPSPQRRSRIRVLLAACAALVVAGLGYQSVTASVGAAQATEVLTQAAISASDPHAKQGQYWEITRIGTTLYSDTQDRWFIVRTTGVDYVAVDGKRPSWFVRGGARTVRQLAGTPSDDPVTWAPREAWTTNLAPEQKPAWWSEPSPSWLAALPRDTTALRERLYTDTRGHGTNPDDEAFVYVADVLRSGVVPADLRSALYSVLKTIPGTVVVDRQVTLEDGRSGVAIGRNDIFGTHNEFVIAPGTGEVIGDRSFMRLTPLVGERITLSTGVQRRLVDSVPQDVQRIATRQTCKVVTGEVVCD